MAPLAKMLESRKSRARLNLVERRDLEVIFDLQPAPKSIDRRRAAPRAQRDSCFMRVDRRNEESIRPLDRLRVDGGIGLRFHDHTLSRCGGADLRGSGARPRRASMTPDVIDIRCPWQ